MRRFQYDAGQRIFSEGEDGALAYLVFSGRVEITVETGKGRRVLARLGAGEVFGEMGTIERAPRSASVTALQHTVCLAVNEEELLRLLETDPQAAVAFVKALIRRLRETNAVLAESARPAFARFAPD